MRGLRQRSEFLAANGGKRVAMPAFVLLVRPRGDGDEALGMGFTVTKKIGNAVIRNRIKRRFRALARTLYPQDGVAGADHILIGRSAALTREHADLVHDLRKALGRIRRDLGR
ncbi:ribonuclease P protein component [Sphingomonas sp.]|uniref:ribonuclease P protein component n=1 Tax=Sphingomonas sp. TaxID=28214 RepID=UPI0025E4E000|nr:ribonuclease P protein component [Sphingomonas sp.]